MRNSRDIDCILLMSILRIHIHSGSTTVRFAFEDSIDKDVLQIPKTIVKILGELCDAKRNFLKDVELSTYSWFHELSMRLRRPSESIKASSQARRVVILIHKQQTGAHAEIETFERCVEIY
ncbi:hypothetical protein AVEN_143483-1 [Araneus ventricosus]|uniref:Uncharacterized protein n=1 Tax=Araneus ventricosus TaxID=182803 RepID=A0A4Y2PW01_ARAVE|nr:hypothetical protein AVEN_143483-1 [Araneus ventricosus]